MTTTAETVTQAVAKRDTGPAAMIAKYSGDFATVLPSHVKPDTWVRLAQGALKKGKRLQDGRHSSWKPPPRTTPARSSPPSSTPPASAWNPAPSSTT
jgi:hypothetical protein